MSDEKDKSTSKPHAADDVDSIRARLAELQKEREEAQKKANEEEAAQSETTANCLSLAVGDVVHVLGLGTVPCVIADFPSKDTVFIILHDGSGNLRKMMILRSTVTRKVNN